MLHYIKYQNKSTGSKAYEKWYLRAVTDEVIDVDRLAEHMAAHNTPFSKGTIKGILSDAVSCIKELLLEGKAVKLSDLAIFRIGLICKGAPERDKAQPSNVTGFRFNAKSTGQMSVSQLKDEVQLKEQRHYDAGVDSEENTTTEETE